MCNCLSTRRAGIAAGPLVAPGQRLSPPGARPRDQALFEYLGATGLTVIGPASGRRYRFEGRGAQVAVDGRDGAALDTVPHRRPAG
jgi:hypothetical protein